MKTATPTAGFAEPSSQAKAVLSCQGLRRSLGAEEGRVEVLRGVSLTLERGQSRAVAGPSGCGKSTLLYLLGLLDRPDAGEVWLRGRPMGAVSDAARTQARLEAIGFVFQFHFLLAEFTALENVVLPMLRLGRHPERECRERAGALLKKVGLADKAARKANHLSGGERQRVAIARALANDPALLLADEPTGNLDEANAGKVVDLLLEIGADGERAVLLVTHNPAIASRCGECWTMRGGLIV